MVLFFFSDMIAEISAPCEELRAYEGFCVLEASLRTTYKSEARHPFEKEREAQAQSTDHHSLSESPKHSTLTDQSPSTTTKLFCVGIMAAPRHARTRTPPAWTRGFGARARVTLVVVAAGRRRQRPEA
jgi:hypothetical protein